MTKLRSRSNASVRLILHPRPSGNSLSKSYQRAFAEAVELFVVSAYLTEWDGTLKLNPKCRKLRFIVGEDFGITRKAACEAVLRWLPSKLKANFRVAVGIGGFHPKAVFWKDSAGKRNALVGSSNLTRAAFGSNYEANIRSALSDIDYEAVLAWLRQIEKDSVGVSEWLPTYTEARLVGKGTGQGKKTKVGNRKALGGSLSAKALELPQPLGTQRQVDNRRALLRRYAKQRAGLTKLFRECAKGNVTSTGFYEELPRYWSHEQGTRMQGAGWERQGKGTKFNVLAQSFVRVLDAAAQDRYDVVRAEIDTLRVRRIRARRAFLSEMLCIQFPDLYPVVNQPVKDYLSDVGYRPPAGASEGARYIDLAQRLRLSLQKNPKHPAKNIAELDTVIWLKYHD